MNIKKKQSQDQLRGNLSCVVPVIFFDKNHWEMAAVPDWLLVMLKHWVTEIRQRARLYCKLPQLAPKACIYTGNDFALAHLWRSQCTFHIHKWIISTTLSNCWEKLLVQASQSQSTFLVVHVPQDYLYTFYITISVLKITKKKKHFKKSLI